MIVQVRLAGVASTFALPSRARTRNVCWPRRRFVNFFGVWQDFHAPASSLHWKVEATSLERNRKVALLAETRPDG